MAAQCNSSWVWASNSLNQNPCTIAGALEAACRSLGGYILDPLNGTNYVIPQATNELDLRCECNTVMYSLFMACTACQGEPLETWDFWVQNCESVLITQYPLNIPIGTAVPHWAYLNVTILGTWSQTDSQNQANEPESTGTKPPVSTLPVSTSSSGTWTQTSSALPTNTSSQPSGGGSNTGAIVGGVVGGLVGLGVLAAAVWFIIKRKLSKVAPSSAFVNNPGSPNTFNYPNHPAQMAYNPSDPSTFPTALRDPSIDVTNSHSQMLHHPRSMISARYNGVPEV